MKIRILKIRHWLLALTLGCSIHAVHALPALQLGPGDTNDDWTYVGGGNDTWILNGFGSLAAYANADTSGANGSYAWDTAGAGTQIGYLVVAATPQASDATDIFDITVVNDGFALSLFDSGFGNPPLEDPNSMAGHGIFDTYFEIYKFNFDGLVETIFNTQPGESGSGDGYSELFDVAVNWLDASVAGLHFDLFTASGDGVYIPGYTGPDKKLMKASAPFSHDAEMMVSVPEPGALVLLGLGLLGLRIRGSGRR